MSRMNQFKVYVGNLPFTIEEEGLRDFFSSCGDVTQVDIIVDRETGKKRGFAFVAFGSEEAMNQALSKNGVDISGRPVCINVANQKGRDGGGRGRRGFGG